MSTSVEMHNTCSTEWANEDPRFKGPHTCHLRPGHEAQEHECACGARPVEVLAA